MNYSPRPYQTVMTEAAVAGSVLLGAPPGLGKTAAALAAVVELLDRGEFEPVLWVGPKNVVEDTVPNELAVWDQFNWITYRCWTASDLGYERNDERKLEVSDPAGLVAAVRAESAMLHAVSKDNFAAFAFALGKAWPYRTVVFDESWAFSDRAAGRWKIAWSMIKHGWIRRAVLLNGTVIGNSLEKLFGQMALVDKGAALGTRIGKFRDAYMEPDKVDPRKGIVYSWRPREGAVEEVIERCRGKIITLRETDWLTLPEVVTRVVGVQIPMKPYRQMERDLLLPVAGDKVALAASAGVLYNKLAQLACGLLADEDGNWHEIHRAKLDALAEIAAAHPGPLLIWTSFREDIERVCKLLPGAVAATSIKRDLERDWNAGKIRYLVAHPASLGAGANLQKCPGSGEVWFGVTGNALQYNQASKRQHRSGRREPLVRYVILARGTVEERMQALRGDRDALETHVMDALAFSAS